MASHSSTPTSPTPTTISSPQQRLSALPFAASSSLTPTSTTSVQSTRSSRNLAPRKSSSPPTPALSLCCKNHPTNLSNPASPTKKSEAASPALTHARHVSSPKANSTVLFSSSKLPATSLAIYRS